MCYKKDTVISEIVAKLSFYDKIKKAVLFGSRARGDNTERSDYDIAIYGDLNSSEQSELRHFCSEVIRTLHKVDLVFINEKLNPKLIFNIEKEGKVIYEQAGI